MRSSAFLGLANLAANASNHRSILQENCLEFLIEGAAIAASEPTAPGAAAPERLLSVDEPTMRCISALRGLSCDADIRSLIIRRGGLSPLLTIAKRATLEAHGALTESGSGFDGGAGRKKKSKDGAHGPQPWDRALEMEAVATLLNLSLSGCIGENPMRFLQACDAPTLVGFLCSPDKTFRLFGATALGNVATSPLLQPKLMAAGALDLLITVANSSDLETQRCAAYAIGNLATDYSLRAKVVATGGLPALISLACSEDASDQKAATATLRGFTASPLTRTIMVDAGVLDAMSSAAQCQDDVEVCTPPPKTLNPSIFLRPLPDLVHDFDFNVVRVGPAGGSRGPGSPFAGPR